MKQFLLTFLAALLLTSCNQRAGYRTVEGSVWHTTYRITYRADRPLDDSIAAALMRVENSLSVFNDESLVSLVNISDSRKIGADSLFMRVMAMSRRVNALSRGAFDPTVEPLVNLWGFGRDGEGSAPSEAGIAAVLESVGIQDCFVDADGRVVKKTNATHFDFSAIAKGLGCDAVGEALRRGGATDYMVEIGGEIALAGTNPRGEPWHIMIDAPVESRDSVVHSELTTVALTDCGVATSGNYRNYRDLDGRRVGHTISPLTGHPVETATLSATVIAPTAMEADALATACMAMPAAEAMAMIDSLPRTEAMLVVGGEKLTILRSKNFPQRR